MYIAVAKYFLQNMDPELELEIFFRIITNIGMREQGTLVQMLVQTSVQIKMQKAVSNLLEFIS